MKPYLWSLIFLCAGPANAAGMWQSSFQDWLLTAAIAVAWSGMVFGIAALLTLRWKPLGILFLVLYPIPELQVLHGVRDALPGVDWSYWLGVMLSLGFPYPCGIWGFVWAVRRDRQQRRKLGLLA
ncbi:hypothetical protein [Deinococcus cellulosilyticus]|uniref:Uncharacterized protein n=1 Tax=Deinococcus cellulosilyticus (strain DSM 18568 / NBRC 106333 / KACC 11606 / 5516J-15) TaxID=1223518 RepID=A0A511N6M2_DEIC1|nr:hypothetical protein [Deinococcus cellulosilyticus]GEM48051.1 hypothetical protein DC3_36860 [Deinococcus cellulosilyticus NBRC 106333 = KACC 11606]